MIPSALAPPQDSRVWPGSTKTTSAGSRHLHSLEVDLIATFLEMSLHLWHGLLIRTPMARPYPDGSGSTTRRLADYTTARPHDSDD